jgi:hypothetical protein
MWITKAISVDKRARLVWFTGADMGTAQEQVDTYTRTASCEWLSHPRRPAVHPCGFGIRKRLIHLTVRGYPQKRAPFTYYYYLYHEKKM